MNKLLPEKIIVEFGGMTFDVLKSDDYKFVYTAKEDGETYDTYVWKTIAGNVLKTDKRIIKMKKGDTLTLSANVHVSI